MKSVIAILAILFSMNSFAAHFKTCDWNGNKRRFVVPNKEALELIRDSLKVQGAPEDKIKEVESIVLLEEESSASESPSVCDLVSKAYRVSSEKCKRSFRTEGFLYLMKMDKKAIEDSRFDCKVGLNIRLLFY